MLGLTHISDVGIFCNRSGSGLPLVFIHGFGQSSYAWRWLSAQLPGYEHVALDLKGFGNSDKPNDGRYGPADQAELVAELIASKDLAECVLVGHSFGGLISLQVASRLEETQTVALRGLVLIDAAAYPQKLPDFMRLFRTPVLGELSVWLLPARTATRIALLRAYRRREAITADAVAEYARGLAQPGARRALLETARHMLPPNLEQITARYGDIAAPTLIIWGEQDTIIPLHVAHSLRENIQGARLEIVADCGHCPPEECPEQVGALMREFLAQIGYDAQASPPEAGDPQTDAS